MLSQTIDQIITETWLLATALLSRLVTSEWRETSTWRITTAQMAEAQCPSAGWHPSRSAMESSRASLMCGAMAWRHWRRPLGDCHTVRAPVPGAFERRSSVPQADVRVLAGRVQLQVHLPCRKLLPACLQDQFVLLFKGVRGSKTEGGANVTGLDSGKFFWQLTNIILQILSSL